MSAVNEFRKLTKMVIKELHLVKVPSLIIQSKIDTLQESSNTSLVYNSISSETKEKIIIENATHNLFIKGPAQPFIYNKITSFLNVVSL